MKFENTYVGFIHELFYYFLKVLNVFRELDVIILNIVIFSNFELSQKISKLSLKIGLYI